MRCQLTGVPLAVRSSFLARLFPNDPEWSVGVDQFLFRRPLFEGFWSISQLQRRTDSVRPIQQQAFFADECRERGGSRVCALWAATPEEKRVLRVQRLLYFWTFDRTFETERWRYGPEGKHVQWKRLPQVGCYWFSNYVSVEDWQRRSNGVSSVRLRD